MKQDAREGDTLETTHFDKPRDDSAATHPSDNGQHAKTYNENGGTNSPSRKRTVTVKVGGEANKRVIELDVPDVAKLTSEHQDPNSFSTRHHEEHSTENKMPQGMFGIKSPRTNTSSVHEEEKTMEEDDNDEIMSTNSPIELLIPEGVSGDEKEFYTKLFTWMKDNGGLPSKIPIMGFKTLDLYNLYMQVTQSGGFDTVTRKMMANTSEGVWTSIFKKLKNHKNTITNSASRLRKYYQKYLLAYENAHFVPPPYVPPEPKKPSKHVEKTDGDSVPHTNGARRGKQHASAAKKPIELKEDFTPVTLRFFAKDPPPKPIISPNSRRDKGDGFSALKVAINQANTLTTKPTLLDTLLTLEEANEMITRGEETADSILHVTNKLPVLEVNAKIDNNSPTGRAILSELPMQQMVTIFGQLLYFTIPPITRKPGVKYEKKTVGKELVEKGQLVHWEEGGAVCLPWGRTGVQEEEEQLDAIKGQIKDLGGKCKLVEPCAIFGGCEQTSVKYQIDNDGKIEKQESETWKELDNVKEGFLILVQFHETNHKEVDSQENGDVHSLEEDLINPPRKRRKVSQRKEDENTTTDSPPKKIVEESLTTTTPSQVAQDPPDIRREDARERLERMRKQHEAKMMFLERQREKYRLEEMEKQKASQNEKEENDHTVHDVSISDHDSPITPVLEDQFEPPQESVEIPPIVGIVPIASPLPANLREVNGADVDNAFNIIIRYKYEGEQDNDSRLLKKNVQLVPEQENGSDVIELNGRHLIHLLQQDRVDTDNMEEVRYYEYGSDDESSGWVLLNDSYRCRLNRNKPNGKTKIKLQLKPNMT